MNGSRRRDLLSWYRICSNYRGVWADWGLWKAWGWWFLFFLLLALLGSASQGARQIVNGAAEGATSYPLTYLGVVLLFMALICTMLLKPESASRFGVFLRGVARVVAVGGQGMVVLGAYKVVESLVHSRALCATVGDLVWVFFMPLLLVIAAIGTRLLFPAARRVGLGDSSSDSPPRVAAWLLLFFIFLSFFFVGNPYEIAGVKHYQAALNSLKCE